MFHYSLLFKITAKNDMANKIICIICSTVDVVENLLHHNACINAQNARHETPLMLAVSQNQEPGELKWKMKSLYVLRWC